MSSGEERGVRGFEMGGLCKELGFKPPLLTSISREISGTVTSWKVCPLVSEIWLQPSHVVEKMK